MEQQPTPYSPPPLYGHTPRRGAPLWIWLLLALGCGGVFMIVILAAILFPVFATARESARRAACVSNIKQLGMALQMYAVDYDNRVPDSGAWMDRISPYIGDPVRYYCPALGRGAAGPGYAFNQKFSRIEVTRIADPMRSPMLYDSTSLARNASDPFTSLPVPGRHRGRNVIGYADGHAAAVEWP